MSWWTRIFLKLGGVFDPNGQMPGDMAASFRRHPQHLRDLADTVDTMVAWHPVRVILAHGRWHPANGTAKLSRAFRWLE